MHETPENAAVPEGGSLGRTMTGGLRRRPRVGLRVPVRVSGTWTDGVQTFVPLLARSVNLSEGGMSVVTPLLLEEGSLVMLSMRLDGEPVYLQGRVAWRRPADGGELKTMGIEFTDASDADRAPLQRALSRFSKRHPVELHFTGHDGSVRAHARTDGAQLRIAARLPFLANGNEVEFSLGDVGATYRGRVCEVSVENAPRTPSIEVWLTVEREHRPELRALVERLEGRALPEPTWELESPVQALAHDSTPVPPVEARSRPRVGQRSTIAMTRLQFLGACCASLAIGALLAAVEPTRGASSAPTTAAATAARATGADRAAPARDHGSAQAAHVGGADHDRAQHPAALRQEAGNADGAPAVHAPRIDVSQAARIVGVPIEGSLEGLEHFRLASPPGIGIDLPHAHATLPDAKYRIHRDGLLWLRVRRTEDRTRLRLFIAERDALDAYRVEPTRQRIDVVLPPQAPR